MSFVSLGGTEAARPTFFELIAAERLMPSLKAATVYSLSVLGQHRGWVYRLLEYEHEVFAALAAFLDYGSLSAGSGTFSESLYSLRRAPVVDALPSGDKATSDEGIQSVPLLSQTQQQRALLFTVALPYLNSKLTALYERNRTAPTAMPGLAIYNQQRQQHHQQQEEAPPDREGHQSTAAHMTGVSSLSDLRQILRLRLGTWLQAVSSGQWGHRLRGRLLAAFMQVYPMMYAAQESCKAALQVAYLVGRTPHYSPPLWMLGQRVVRVSATELAQAERQRAQERQQALEHVASRGGLLRRLVQQAWLRGSYLLTDHTRNALILSVFAFKALEWWYTSAEGKLAGQAVLPPPPPPPPPPGHPQGLPLPEDPADCAICSQQRTNPAIVDVSGFAFCYPCIFRFIEANGCCPVTRRPVGQDNIRRVYPNT